MNIAIINTLAKSGSTGKIAYSFYEFLRSEGHTPYLFYGRDDEQVMGEGSRIIRIGNNLDKRIHALSTRITGLQGVYSKNATKKLLEKFSDINIDAVCMFNLHGYYINSPMLFRYLGEKKIPCEYVMLDEYPFLGKCSYSFECEKYTSECNNCPRIHDYPKSFFLDSSKKMFWIKKKMYEQVPQCVFVGIGYTVDRAKRSAITKNCRFEIADEAIDLKNMYYPRDSSELRKKLGIPATNKVIVTVIPYPNDRKGGQYFLEAARRLEKRQDISFVHVGFNVNTRECPSNYVPIGYVKDQNLLSEYYSLGDLFVHTSTAETIPASILEALACGTPILGFNASGIPYSADEEHGTFVEPCNVEQMIEVILKTPYKDENIIKSCRSYAESRYDSNIYNTKLLSFLRYGEEEK